MEPPRPAERLTIYLSGTRHKGRVADYVEIVRRARETGLAGAMVIQGTEGFGNSARVHRRGGLTLSDDVPVAVTVIDTCGRISRFLADIEPLVQSGKVVRQPTEIVIQRGGPRRSGGRRR